MYDLSSGPLLKKKQCTYDVTLMCVRVTVAVENKNY